MVKLGLFITITIQWGAREDIVEALWEHFILDENLKKNKIKNQKKIQNHFYFEN